MAAFTLAERMGVREVELDIQLSRDAHLVICHDRMLDRYGYPGRVVAGMTLHELKMLDMGSWFSHGSFQDERMLTLDELFDRFGARFTYHIEIKEPAPGIEQAVLDTVDSHGLRQAVVVTSFHYAVLAKVRKLCRQIPTGWLVKKDGLSRSCIDQAVLIGCLQICPKVSDLTADQVAEARRWLPEVRAFGVKTLDDVLRVVETGCDGLTIDHPDWLRHR